MKKFYVIICVAIALLTQLQAQAPQGFNYQATVRDAGGNLILNTSVYFKFNIQQGSQTAVPSYTEVHFVPTDDLGQVNLVIGQGTPSTGVFSQLDWSLGSYFLSIELDTGTGSGYVAMGTTQLLSVPYALYAENSGNSIPTTPNLQAVLAENNSANNQQIKDLQDPTEAQDVVTKAYNDALIANLQSQIDDLDSDNSSGMITDQDGNTYDYLTYGDQKWTVENAEMVTYRDGTEIPQVTDTSEWGNLTTGAWCYYNNDSTKPRLYNWYAVMGIHDEDSLLDASKRKEFAPQGWRVPSYAEWTALKEHLIANSFNYDGTTIGNKIGKAMASTTGWNSSTDLGVGAPGNDQSLNNSSGFNAFPVGSRSNNFSSSGEGDFTAFWSSTDVGYGVIYYILENGINGLGMDSCDNVFDGFSVRFVRDGEGNLYDIDNDGDGYTENQGDCDDLDALSNPGATEIRDCIDNNCDGVIDEGFNDESGTVADQNSNNYNYLSYGCLVWTVENAEMVTYRDGTEIPQVTDNTEWTNLTTGAWCYYNNDSTKPRLYNWYAVMGIHDAASLSDATLRKEFAPEGWHVPSDAEWTNLENHLIATGYNYDGTTTENRIAKAMASITGWNSSTINGAPGNDQSLNNGSGFNAFPVGLRESVFGPEGDGTAFWSSTENNTDIAWFRYLNVYNSNLYRTNSFKRYGFSVRFVRD